MFYKYLQTKVTSSSSSIQGLGYINLFRRPSHPWTTDVSSTSGFIAVSYTHLDVYKRQFYDCREVIALDTEETT